MANDLVILIVTFIFKYYFLTFLLLVVCVSDGVTFGKFIKLSINAFAGS